MRMHQKSILAIAALGLLLAFQNCSPSPQQVQFSKSQSSVSEGNGQGYDGKVYLVVGDLCSDASRVQSKIIVRSQTSADLVRANCQDITPLALSAADFQINAANTDQLFYGSTLFTAQIPTAGSVLSLKTAFAYSGFRYALYFNFGTAADTSSALTQSKLQLYEDGVLLGPAHSVHADIANLGMGRFSHWSDTTGEQLLFSASDNSNPLTNGRVYSFKVSP